MAAIKVHEKCDAVKHMEDGWNLISALRGGTTAMRQLAEKYLPKKTMETKEDYDKRCSQSTLLPAFTETVKSMTGRVFAEPLVPDDKTIPKWIQEEVLPDVDTQGRNIHVFANDLFDFAVSYGHIHVLTEASDGTKPDGTVVRTIADQKAAKQRPFGIIVEPWQVLGWKEKDGALQQLRLKWCRKADEEFGETDIPQIRVYELNEQGKVILRVFEKAPGSGQGDADEKWVEVPDLGRVTELKRIPFDTYYTKRTGFMTSEPPLRELAHLNIKHWSKQSTNDALIETASVPILTITGVEGTDDKIVIGAKAFVKLPLNGKMEFCEHSGKAIESGAKSLEALLEDMRQAGARLLEKGGGQPKTAEEAGEDNAARNSQLGGMVGNFEVFLGQWLSTVASYRNEEKGGSVDAQPNLEAEYKPIETLNFLLAMNVAGKLSDRTMFEETKRRGLISDELTWEKEQVRISQQPDPAETEPKEPEPTSGKTSE